MNVCVCVFACARARAVKLRGLKAIFKRWAGEEENLKKKKIPESISQKDGKKIARDYHYGHHKGKRLSIRNFQQCQIT